jgi:DNA-binding GntR family transcriptional regulator
MNIDSTEIQSPTSLAGKAYDELIRRITRLDLPPGTVLAEKSLVEELQIGRTPIREALQRLAMEGLVIHRLNRGMFVSEITYSDVQEIYEFRSLIDGHACRLAAQRATPAQAAKLLELHGALVQATKDDDIDAYVQLDREYYSILSEASKNSFLVETIPRIFNLHLRLWFFISVKIGNWHSIAVAHEIMTHDVAEAIALRDTDRAEVAMKNYISQRHQDLRRQL